MDVRRNPFRPASGVMPAVLAGRPLNDVEVALDRALLGHPSPWLIFTGLRGAGKTAMLNRLTALARARCYEVAHLRASDDRDFLENVLGAFTRFSEIFSSRYSPSAERMQWVLQRMHSSQTITVLSDDLREFMLLIGDLSRAHHAGIFVAIDELEQLSPADVGLMLRGFEAVYQAAELPIVFAGAGLEQCVAHMRKGFAGVEALVELRSLDSLSRDEVDVAVNTPARALDSEFLPAAIDRIADLSNGSPLFVQRWAYEAWNAAGAASIDVDVIDRIANDVWDMLDNHFFLPLVERLSPQERRYVHTMASLGMDDMDSRSVSRALSMTIQRTAPIRDGLIRKGILNSLERGMASFTVPLFADFLLRRLAV